MGLQHLDRRENEIAVRSIVVLDVVLLLEMCKRFFSACKLSFRCCRVLFGGHVVKHNNVAFL